MHPDQTTPKGAVSSGVHIVSYHENIQLDVHLNICIRRKKQATVSLQAKRPKSPEALT